MFIKNRKGFTLLEILLVVSIIGILAGMIIVAINPAKQFATVRNTQRITSLSKIYNAIQMYYFDNMAYPTSTIPVTLTEICNTGYATSSVAAGVDCTGLVDLSAMVPNYIDTLPTDPSGPSAYLSTYGTGFQINKDLLNKIGLKAPAAELEKVITIGIH